MIASGLQLAEVMQAGSWKSPVVVASYGERLIAKRGAGHKLAKTQARS